MKTRFKPKYNIRKGDQVIIISGDDKDIKKPRLVKEVLVDDAKVIVEGANIITKHTKPSAQNTKGGIIKKEAPIHMSNVMLIDGKGKTTRVGYKEVEGKLVRYSKKSEEVIK